MSLASIVKETCGKLDISISELSRRIGQSPQNLGKKLNNETLNYEEFLEILNTLGVKYEYRLTTAKDDAMELMSNRTRVKFEILDGKLVNQQRLIEYLYHVLRDVKAGLETISETSMDAISHLDDKKSLETFETLNLAVEQMASLLGSGQKIIEVATGKEYNEEGQPLVGLRCLLVEGKEFQRNATKELLEAAGLVVETAGDGSSAIDTAIGGGFDFIIMENDLPVLDGFSAARIIREKDKHIPMIALLMHSTFENIVKAKECGMDDYVVKPIPMSKLVQAVQKLVK